jgi:hypothetical protein
MLDFRFSYLLFQIFFFASFITLATPPPLLIILPFIFISFRFHRFSFDAMLPADALFSRHHGFALIAALMTPAF